MSAGAAVVSPGKSLNSLTLSLTALGVVFGDIGTSPLYAIRECFHHIPVNYDNVLGILSLVFWSLILVISLKYITYVLRADNHGEGGVLALLALAHSREGGVVRKPRRLLVYLGLFGFALLYGDGMITPAVSVLSAVEGMEVYTPLFKPYVVPVAVALLALLFLPQRFGTEKIGRAFGPLLLVWFFVIAWLGVMSIIKHPAVLAAINPIHALWFFENNGSMGFITLGFVVLVVTGGESLYADLGHFGRKPITIAWFAVVLPALILNYFGQGALLLVDPSAAVNPFFRLAPPWAMLPLVIISTLAAVVASQALISGIFSMTRQAVQLGYLPRQKIVHTSVNEIGQVFLPRVNWVLCLATIALVVIFRSSTSLAAAYGLAVTATMLISTILIHVVAKEVWHWRPWMVYGITCVFGSIDLAFLGANMTKIHEGGYVPLCIAGIIFIATTTWRKGRMLVAKHLQESNMSVQAFRRILSERPVVRVDGAAVFMTSVADGVPTSLLHNLKHNKVLHKRVVILTVKTATVPHMSCEGEIIELENGFYQCALTFGFMDTPRVARALESLLLDKIKGEDFSDLTYFVGRETLVSTRKPGMVRWRERLFALMARNSEGATDYFRLPAEKVFEIGIMIEL